MKGYRLRPGVNSNSISRVRRGARVRLRLLLDGGPCNEQEMRHVTCESWPYASSLCSAPNLLAQATGRHLPERVPPKRSSQITDGFGINSDMPRDPYLALGALVVDADVRRRASSGSVSASMRTAPT